MRQGTKALRECEWEKIFDAIYDWVCLINRDAEIIRSNMVGIDYFGLPVKNIVGQRCYKLVHGTEKPIEQCPLPKMLKSGMRESAEIKAKDGRWVLETVDPIYDDAGTIVRAVHILRDITARKNIQFEREKLLLELQKAHADVDTLSGLIPICSVCKKIRDDKGYWNQLEIYIKMRANVDFSHGICPDCAKECYPNMDLYDV